jgi:hypothetical protein
MPKRFVRAPSPRRWGPLAPWPAWSVVHRTRAGRLTSRSCVYATGVPSDVPMDRATMSKAPMRSVAWRRRMPVRRPVRAPRALRDWGRAARRGCSASIPAIAPPASISANVSQARPPMADTDCASNAVRRPADRPMRARLRRLLASTPLPASIRVWTRTPVASTPPVYATRRKAKAPAPTARRAMRKRAAPTQARKQTAIRPGATRTPSDNVHRRSRRAEPSSSLGAIMSVAGIDGGVTMSVAGVGGPGPRQPLANS